MQPIANFLFWLLKNTDNNQNNHHLLVFNTIHRLMGQLTKQPLPANALKKQKN